MKEPVIWIVVADHQRARIYESGGLGSGMQPVAGMDFATHLHASRDIVSDRPGHGFAGRTGRIRGGRRYAVEPRTDPHREEGQHFIAALAGRLGDACKSKAFDKLVLVAPPRALGEFRSVLPDNVRRKMIAEIAEDLTKEPVESLARHLAAHITS
jgi:protein required for attachment to host cells